MAMEKGSYEAIFGLGFMILIGLLDDVLAGDKMEAFESIVASILENEGYWVRRSFKVDLSKEGKKKIGRPSFPHWEFDLIAYKGLSNELLIIECKSFLDSPGVRCRGFDGTDPKNAKRYKLFNDAILREIVFNRLKKQLVTSGGCPRSLSPILCLAAGKVASENDRLKIKEHFGRKGWRFFDDAWIRERLGKMSKSAYENDVAPVVAKILLRQKLRNHQIL